MLDHMTMPVLFLILIAVLAIVSAGVYVATRVAGERIRTREAKAEAKTGRPPAER